MASGVVVVVPFYNGSAYLEKAVDSVRTQTVPPDEFVIVNDGSSGRETEWLHRLCGKLSIRCIDKPNGGQGSARNLGVKSTTAPYICFLDQDDYFLPDHIETLLQDASRRNDFGWVYADLSRADAQGKFLFTNVVTTVAEHPKVSVVDMVRRDMFVLPSASLISRTAFNAVGGFDEQFAGYEDDDLFLRMYQAGFSNSFIDKPVTVWRLHSDSTSFSARMTISRMRYFLKLAKTFSDIEAAHIFFMRDALVPRFARTILKETQLAFRSGNRLSDHREQIFELAAHCVDAMLSNPALRRDQRSNIRRRWLHAKLLRARARVFERA